MATFVITKVHLVPSAGSTVHHHIGSVMLSSGRVEQRSTVIVNIRAGHVYVTNGTPPGRVYVHPCPYCGARDYITTHPDGTATNNLLHLPKF